MISKADVAIFPGTETRAVDETFIESELDPGNLAIWLQLARDAMA